MSDTVDSIPPGKLLVTPVEFTSYMRSIDIKWSIADYCKIEANGILVKSNRFTVPLNHNNSQDVMLQLKLFPSKVNSANVTRQILQIDTKSNLKPVLLQLKLYTIDKNGGQYGLSMFHLDVLTHKCTSGRHLINRDDLLKKPNDLLPNGTLTIGCTIISNEMVEKDNYSQPNDAMAQLTRNLSKLLVPNARFSDVQISIAGKTFNAHRAILSARSPVFATLFKSKSEEKAADRLEITDIKHSTFVELLAFIYTGKVAGKSKMDINLLVAADKYQMNLLKEQCEEYLSHCLNIDSVVKTLAIADMHSAGHLKRSCIKFIASNAEKVITSTDWKELGRKHSKLALDVMQQIIIIQAKQGSEDGQKKLS